MGDYSRQVRAAYEVYAVESPVLGSDFMKVPRKIGLCFPTERSLVYSDPVYRLPSVGNCRAQVTRRFVPRGRNFMAVLLCVADWFVAETLSFGSVHPCSVFREPTR